MNIEQSIKIFSALAHSGRMKILKKLIAAGDDGLCPCNLAKYINTSNANLSFHLKELEHANLISKKRNGKYIFYYANCKLISDLSKFLIEDCEKGKCLC